MLDAEHACLDAARHLPDLTERVVFLDACAHERWLDLDRLAGRLDTWTAARGVQQLRQAHALADAAVRSPWESRLRVLCVLDCGMVGLLVNVPVFDLDGNLLAIVDLLDEGAGLALEFDGQHHRGRHQHRRDNVREEVLERANLTVVRADSLDMLRYRTALRARILHARADGLARDRRRDRWTLQVPPDWAPADDYVMLSDADKQELLG